MIQSIWKLPLDPANFPWANPAVVELVNRPIRKPHLQRIAGNGKAFDWPYFSAVYDGADMAERKIHVGQLRWRNPNKAAVCWFGGWQPEGAPPPLFTHEFWGQIVDMIVRRQKAKRERNFALADAIRREIAAAQIELMDVPTGTEWVFSVDCGENLMRYVPGVTDANKPIEYRTRHAS